MMFCSLGEDANDVTKSDDANGLAGVVRNVETMDAGLGDDIEDLGEGVLDGDGDGLLGLVGVEAEGSGDELANGHVEALEELVVEAHGAKIGDGENTNELAGGVEDTDTWRKMRIGNFKLEKGERAAYWRPSWCAWCRRR